MNKRIRELAEQAGFYYTDKTGFITPAGCDPAKFAELIVAECALTAGLMEHEGRKGIGAQILDNFGVEE
jgi:hypothetical protein